MINNLIFGNGSTFALCPYEAPNAPRMSAPWRGWHMEATSEAASDALVTGLSHREYESVTGTDEDGNPVTEVLTEDLSRYIIGGSVCDHMDDTVTVWARPQTEAERTADACGVLGVDTSDPGSAAARLGEIQTLAAKADMTGEDAVIVDLPPDYCKEWTADTEYKVGNLLSRNAVKYLVIQSTTSQAHYPPDMADGAMLAVYKPYQGRERYTWLYGEYTEVGFTRYDGADLYVCIADPGANIYPPSQVPACWSIVN